jgi:hypothetical protein
LNGPYEFGVNELDEPSHNYGSVSTIWKTNGQGQEWWKADFADGELEIDYVNVHLQFRYTKCDIDEEL